MGYRRIHSHRDRAPYRSGVCYQDNAVNLEFSSFDEGDITRKPYRGIGEAVAPAAEVRPAGRENNRRHNAVVAYGTRYKETAV